jgi:hypothetical protein
VLPGQIKKQVLRLDSTFYNYSDNDYKVKVGLKNLANNGYDGTGQWVKRFHDQYESATAQVELGVTGKKYADKLLLGLIASENNKDIQTGVTTQAVYGALRSKSHSLIPTLKYKKNDLFTNGLDFNLYTAYNTNNFKLIDTTPRNYNWLASLCRSQLRQILYDAFRRLSAGG